MNLKQVIVLISAILFTSTIFAQEVHSHNGESCSEHHHLSEIGVGNALVYFTGEGEFAYGLHLHYVRGFKNSKFGVGLAYERIFDEHGHNTLSPELIYRPIDRLSLSLAPGVSVEDEHFEPKLSMHLEATYDFELKYFHIGPTLGFGMDPEDRHVSLGLHIGFPL